MADLDILLREYGQFEDRLRTAMTGMCAVHCCVCTRVCCREELCRETFESPFLRLLCQKYPPSAEYDSRNGWLTKTGCALSIGRAPVCYHFLCSEIMISRPTPLDGYMLEVLAALVNHVGKKALGRRHLVEILNSNDLTRVKLSRFKRKLVQAQTALDIIVDYFDHGTLDVGNISKLSQIRPFPSDKSVFDMMKSNSI